jgi:surface antigen
MKCDIFDWSPLKSKNKKHQSQFEGALLDPLQYLNELSTADERALTLKHNTKVMKHTKHFKTRLLSRASIVTIMSVVVIAGIAVPVVRADQYDDQINALNNQNASASDSLTSLQSQASSYQDAINQLQTQISAVQAQIADSQAQQTSLQQQITDKQTQLDQQRALLGDAIKTMYVDGQLSSIEMLATSKNLSDYVDKQEYNNTVQQNVQDSLTKINALQAQLKIQKTQVDQLITNQTAQQSQLSASQAQQASLLAYSQAQQTQFTQQITANSSKIASLRQQQIIANEKYTIGPAGTGTTCGGGYPAKWCEVPQDSTIDSWGMYNRECVSYTAFRVHEDFLAGKDTHDMPYWGGDGNADEWDEDAEAAGIPVDTSPTVGSIAISNAGAYGHAMYVEQVGTVNGQPAIYVSQYNASLNGLYSEGWRYTTGLVFLHF